MERRAVASAVFLLLLAGIATAETNNLCPLNPTPAYMDIILEPPSGPGSIVTTYVYNISKDDYVKNGISGALIIVVNQTDISNPNLCYEVTDSQGWANFTYNSNFDGCTDYWFIFCPQPDALVNLEARQTCLNGTGLPQSLINSAITRPCNRGGSPSMGTRNYLLAHNQFYLCTQQQKTYSGLCWPLMLIFGLLLGANFLLGKNPFGSFDFSAIRMNRGRQYTMRAQQRSTDITSIVMGVMSASETVTGGNGLQTALRKAAVSLGNAIGGDSGKEGSGPGGNKNKTPPPSKTQTPVDPNAPKSVLDGSGAKDSRMTLFSDGGDKKVNNTQTTQMVVNEKPSSTGTKPGTGPNAKTTTDRSIDLSKVRPKGLDNINSKIDLTSFSKNLAVVQNVSDATKTNTVGNQGTQYSNTLMTMMSAPSILGLFYVLFSKEYRNSWDNPTMPVGLGTWKGAVDYLWEIIRKKLLTISTFGASSGKEREGWGVMLTAGERMLTAMKSVMAAYELLGTMSKFVKNAKMGWKGFGGKSKRNREIGGIGFIDDLKQMDAMNLFGRQMNLGEMVQIINEPSSVYLLSFFAPIIDSGRDKLDLMTSITPDKISTGGKEVSFENKLFTVTAGLRIFDSNGNEVTSTVRDNVLRDQGMAGSWENAMDSFAKLTGRVVYLEIGADNKASQISGIKFDQNMTLQINYEEARKKVLLHNLEYLSTRGSKDEQEMMRRFREIVGDSPIARLTTDGIDENKNAIASLVILLGDYQFSPRWGNLASDVNIQVLLGAYVKPDEYSGISIDDARNMSEKNALAILGNGSDAVKNSLAQSRIVQKMLGITWTNPDEHPEEKPRLQGIMEARITEIKSLIENGDALHIANRMNSTLGDTRLLQYTRMYAIVQAEIATVDKLSTMLGAMVRAGADNFANLSQTQEAYLALAKSDALQRQLKFNILVNMDGEPMSYLNQIMGKSHEQLDEERERLADEIQKKRNALETEASEEKKEKLLADIDNLNRGILMVNASKNFESPVSNEDFNSVNKSLFDYYLTYHQNLSASSQAIYEVWSNGGSHLNSLIDASENKWIQNYSGNLKEITNSLYTKTGLYTTNQLPQLNLGLVTQSMNLKDGIDKLSPNQQNVINNAGYYVDAVDLRVQKLSDALAEANDNLSGKSPNNTAQTKFEAYSIGLKAKFLDIQFALRDTHAAGLEANYGTVMRVLEGKSDIKDTQDLTVIKVTEQIGTTKVSTITNLDKVNWNDANSSRDAFANAGIYYLDKMKEMMEKNKDDYDGSYLFGTRNDLLRNVENLRQFVVNTNKEISDKSKEELLGEKFDIDKASDVFIGKMRNGLGLIDMDERRMYETSSTFVRHQLGENAAQLAGASYMSNAFGGTINQARGGSFYNVENDLLSFSMGIGALLGIEVTPPGAYERSLISDSKGLLSLLPDTPLPTSTAGKIIASTVPGAWETQAALYGIGNIPGAELKQDSKFTTSGEGLHNLDLGFEIDKYVKPVLVEVGPRNIPTPTVGQPAAPVADLFALTLHNRSGEHRAVEDLVLLEYWKMQKGERQVKTTIEGQYGSYDITIGRSAENDRFLYDEQFQRMKFDGAFHQLSQMTGLQVTQELIDKTLKWDASSNTMTIQHGAEGGLNEDQILLLKINYRTHATRDNLEHFTFSGKETQAIVKYSGVDLNNVDPQTAASEIVSAMRTEQENLIKADVKAQNIRFKSGGKTISMSPGDIRWSKDNIGQIINEDNSQYVSKGQEPQVERIDSKDLREVPGVSDDARRFVEQEKRKEREKK